MRFTDADVENEMYLDLALGDEVAEGVAFATDQLVSRRSRWQRLRWVRQRRRLEYDRFRTWWSKP